MFVREGIYFWYYIFCCLLIFQTALITVALQLRVVIFCGCVSFFPINKNPLHATVYKSVLDNNRSSYVFCAGWKVYYRLKYFNFCNAGASSEVAAWALSLPDLNQAQTPIPPAGLESQERTTMELEISKLDHMIDDMEMKVNVLRWMVEPHGGQYVDPLSSTNSASLAFLSVDEEQPGHRPLCQHKYMFVLLLLLAVVLVAATLSVCVVFFS